MGISLQEFLAGREPCSVCDATGNQHHCISELLSRHDSCILYNAMGLNQTAETENDTVLLQELRYVSDPTTVLNYYLRSQRIVEDINSRRNKDDIWNHIYNQYLIPVISRLRSRDREGTLREIMRVVEELERSYGSNTKA